MNQKKKLGVGILVGTVISCLTIGMLCCLFVLFFIYGGPPEKTTDINQYQEMVLEHERMQTALIVFPETIPDSAKKPDFYFSFQDTFGDPTMEVFLQCTYDEEDYLAEIERLENIKKHYGGTIHKLKKEDVGRFSYPAYIAMDGYSYSFEYALLSGELEITYIFTSWKNNWDLKKIEEKYLPLDFDSIQKENCFERYSLYSEVVELENGELIPFQNYYSRDDVVRIGQYHSTRVGYGYDSFGVCTYLDENGKEIIEYCYYSYYEDGETAMNGMSKEIQYKELEGYVYKSVSSGKDPTKVLVTYYDGEEEKSLEYEIPET